MRIGYWVYVILHGPEGMLNPTLCTIKRKLLLPHATGHPVSLFGVSFRVQRRQCWAWLRTAILRTRLTRAYGGGCTFQPERL